MTVHVAATLVSRTVTLGPIPAVHAGLPDPAVAEKPARSGLRRSQVTTIGPPWRWFGHGVLRRDDHPGPRPHAGGGGPRCRRPPGRMLLGTRGPGFPRRPEDGGRPARPDSPEIRRSRAAAQAAAMSED